MIVLDSTTKLLQIILSGAVTTNQLQFSASYADYVATPAAFTPGANSGLTNDTTAVTLVGAPAASTQRQVKRINVYNADTAPATVTIRLSDSGNFRTQLSVTLQVGERIEYEDAEGFRVFTVAGAVKVTAVQSTVDQTRISGFKLTWGAANSLGIGTGTAYIPSVGADVTLSSPTSKTVPSTASTFFHVYLFLNAGVPDIEVVSTAPSAAYFGTARTKSGDTTRRYLGSVLTDSTGALIEFDMAPNNCYVQYRFAASGAAPYRVLSAGSAAVTTNISLSGVIPVTGAVGLFRGINTSTTGAILFFANSTYTGASQQLANVQTAPAGSTFTVELPMPCPSQVVGYQASTGGAFLDVKGYIFER